MKTKLDVLFINPSSAEANYQDLSINYSAAEPPIWIGLLASHVKSKGFTAEVIDCEALHMDDTTATYHAARMEPRLICFVIYGQHPSASIQNMTGAVRLAEKMKEQNSNCKIMFIGGCVAAHPIDILQKHRCIDFVAQNEGVYTLSALLATSELTKVPGLAFRYLDNIVTNHPSDIVSNELMNKDLPGIDWDILPLSEYRTSLWHALSNNNERQPFASIYTSLGCPYKCSFCCINIINRTYNAVANESNIYRRWSPEFILLQLDKLATIGVVNLKIADELFVLNPNHFLKICEGIIARGYKFNIWCYARIDTIKPEYLATMKKAGVNWLALGIESANKKVRSDVTKGKFEDVDIDNIIATIKLADINIIANYIFGLPEDTLETMQETLDLAIRLNTEEANFYCAMAYPGSQLEYETKYQLLPKTYSGYSQHSYDCQPLPSKYLFADEVLRFRDNAWMKYHTNPIYLEMIKSKFGEEAYQRTLDSTKIKLKRKLLGD